MGYATDVFNLDAIAEQFKKSDEDLDGDKKTSTLIKVPLGKTLHGVLFYNIFWQENAFMLHGGLLLSGVPLCQMDYHGDTTHHLCFGHFWICY